MISAQVERLQNDSLNLESFIRQLEHEGDLDRMEKIKAKKTYLDKRIAEIVR